MNETGFAALPAGYSYPGGGFDYGGYGAWFWTLAENTNTKMSWQDSIPEAYAMKLQDNDSISLESNDKEYGFSVRCVADS